MTSVTGLLPQLDWPGVGQVSSAFSSLTYHHHSLQQDSQTSSYGNCLLRGCSGLNLYTEVLIPSTPQNVTVFGKRVFKEIIKVNLGPMGGP